MDSPLEIFLCTVLVLLEAAIVDAILGGEFSLLLMLNESEDDVGEKPCE